MAEKESRVTVRLDEVATDRLETLVRETGLNKSQIITTLIKDKGAVVIKDGRKISEALLSIQLLLKRNQYNRYIKDQISEMCNEVISKLYELLQCEEE